MTDIMKCPFCGKKLVYSDFSEQYHCVNDLCKSKGIGFPIFVWESLIDSNATLGALNRIERVLLLDSEKPMTLTPAGKKEIKEIIASITKGDKE